MADTTGQVPEEMVISAAEVMRHHYDSEFNASHLAWQDFMREAREVLSAALAGRVVVDLPKPDVDGIFDGGEHFTAYAENDDGVPSVHFDVHNLCTTWTAETAERAALALLASARHAIERADEFNASRQDAEDALDEQERLRSRTASAPEGGGDDAA